jgi:hypothetical protein
MARNHGEDDDAQPVETASAVNSKLYYAELSIAKLENTIGSN